MTFGLLAPAALALLALIAGPILAHLARQEPIRRQPYGAMLLLERLMKRLRRRRRVRDVWLLLLRLLAVVLAVLAATRPEAKWPGATPELGGSGAVVLVLDNSLSMDLVSGEATLFSRAREEAVAIVRGLPDGALVAAVTAGGEAERLVPALTADRTRVAGLLGGVPQSQGGTDLAGAIRLARQLLGGGGGEVVVLTDEAGPVAVPAAREEIALLVEQGGALVPRPIRAERPANAAIVDAAYGDGPEGGTVRIRVANYGPDGIELPATVRLPDGTEMTAFVEVPAGETAEESVTVPRMADGGVATARIDDGVLAADDSFAFHLPRVGASRVLVVDGDPGATPVASEVYFLERALAPWGTAAAARGGLLPDVTSTAGLGQLDPAVHRVVFLANVADPGPLATRLVEFVREGGGLVVGMGDNITPDRYNGPLAALLPSALARTRDIADSGEMGVPTALPDVTLDLFAPFARGGRRAFANARWWRVMALEPYAESDSSRTLLSTETGIPLLVERRIGLGRVLLLCGTFDLGWGSLPLQAIYMPLVQRMVRYLGGAAGGDGVRLDGRVGTAVAVPLPDARLDVSIQGPRGPVPGRVQGGRLVFVPSIGGAFQVETPGAPPLAWVAVNVDPSESDVRPGPSLSETAAEIDPDRFYHHLALAPWLIGAALALTVAQAAVARTGGPPRAAAPPAELGAA